MAHCFVEAAEKLLDKNFPVLDKGFVRLVDYMGSDDRIVQAARVSYGNGTKSVRQDRDLIFYLLRNLHTSPFEQVMTTWHIKLPIFVARQWIRHRTARVNEISGRYSVMQPEFYAPQTEDISYQATDNKQGRSSEKPSLDEAHEIREQFISDQTEMYGQYKKLIDKNIARELSRINLPLSLYTEWYWQIDLHNLMHFLKLRLDSHAQKEIRVYAEEIYTITKTICPVAMEAFDEYMLNGRNFSRTEIRALKNMLHDQKHDLSEKQFAELQKKLKI